jgi:hypothetical protein
MTDFNSGRLYDVNENRKVNAMGYSEVPTNKPYKSPSSKKGECSLGFLCSPTNSSGGMFGIPCGGTPQVEESDILEEGEGTHPGTIETVHSDEQDNTDKIVNIFLSPSLVADDASGNTGVKDTKRGKGKNCTVLFLFALLLAGIAILIFGFVQRKQAKNEQGVASMEEKATTIAPAPTGAPTRPDEPSFNLSEPPTVSAEQPDGLTLVPTVAAEQPDYIPVGAPTVAPTESSVAPTESSGPPVDISELQILWDGQPDNIPTWLDALSGVTDPSTFVPGAPQTSALQWISTDDSFGLDPAAGASTELTERYVAAVLYFATNGESWSSSYNFLSDSFICSWNEGGIHGIGCDENGVVKQIFIGALLLQEVVLEYIRWTAI